MLRARLAEMHLRVDDAGEHMKARRLENILGILPGQVADGRDDPAPDADIGPDDALRRDGASVLDDEVECIRHGDTTLALATLSITARPGTCR